jgi:hypothetical protein
MVIQMKLIKVNCRMKNMMIQEFQLDMELQLIQDPNLRRHSIQFVSMMTAIQMKLNRTRPTQKNFQTQFLAMNLEPRSASVKSLHKQRPPMCEHLSPQSLVEKPPRSLLISTSLEKKWTDQKIFNNIPQSCVGLNNSLSAFKSKQNIIMIFLNTCHSFDSQSRGFNKWRMA